MSSPADIKLAPLAEAPELDADKRGAESPSSGTSAPGGDDSGNAPGGVPSDTSLSGSALSDSSPDSSDDEELPLPDDHIPPAVAATPVIAAAVSAAAPVVPESPAVSSAEAPEPLAAAGSGGGGGDDIPPAVTHAHQAGKPPPLPKTDDDEPMPLLSHINELRRRLTRVVIVVMLGFIACYGISEPIYAFLSAPLKEALPEGSKLIYTSPQGAFFVYLKVSLMASIFLTSPLSFYQLWAFIAPGLYKEEKRVVMPLAFFSAFFFLIGATFCYLLVFPIAFQFFMGFATTEIVPMISVEEYLSFALKLLLAFGLVFEMPLFAFFLGRMGVLTPPWMRRQRKYAILVIFIVAAILTPPDVFSQCLMAAPMILLYEISIFVAGWARKRVLADKAAREGSGEPPAGEQTEPAEPGGQAHGDA